MDEGLRVTRKGTIHELIYIESRVFTRSIRSLSYTSVSQDRHLSESESRQVCMLSLYTNLYFVVTEKVNPFSSLELGRFWVPFVNSEISFPSSFCLYSLLSQLNVDPVKNVSGRKITVREGIYLEQVSI